MSSWDLYRFARKNRKILNRIEERLIAMSVNVDKLNADIATLVAGYQAALQQVASLQQQLADATNQAQADIAAAVAAEDASAQQAIDAADQVVADTLNPPAPPAS